MKETQRLKINKPRVVCLWSPRGMGKSSVIRRLAKMDEFAESRRCGRLLIFDAAWIPSGQMSVEASTLVSAMVLWHLLQLLDGYGVKLAGQVVNFKRMDFKDVVEVVERRSRPTGSVNSFEAWVRSACTTKVDVFKQWCLVTAAAFNAQQDCACLVLLDQTELLVKQTLDQRSSLGGSRSRFTEVCSQFPQQMAVYCTGTINMQVDLPAEEYSRLVIKSLPALMPLSFKGAKEAMVQWRGTQYGEEVLDQIYLFSAGVPRLLEYVFQTDGELASTLRLHSTPCPNVLKIPIHLQRLSLINQMWHCRWFFAQQFVGTQPTGSLCLGHRQGGQTFSTQEPHFQMALLCWCRSFGGFGIRQDRKCWLKRPEGWTSASKVSCQILPICFRLHNKARFPEGHCGKSRFAMLWPPVFICIAWQITKLHATPTHRS